MENINKSIEDFSKSLLITVFAIFAFASGPLLTSEQFLVKITYMLSLLLSLWSMYLSNKLMVVGINYRINVDPKTQNKDANLAEKQKPIVQRQFYVTLSSLLLLVVSIGFFLCNDTQKKEVTEEVKTSVCGPPC